MNKSHEIIPSAEAVKSFLRANNLTGAMAARMAYLTGSSQIRKYTGGKEPRKMNAARWFCLHAHTILSAKQIADIEKSMINDITEN